MIPSPNLVPCVERCDPEIEVVGGSAEDLQDSSLDLEVRGVGTRGNPEGDRQNRRTEKADDVVQLQFQWDLIGLC